MGVSQISMPMRIVLVAAIVFLAAWFTVLKPGGGEVPTPSSSADSVTSKAGDFQDKAKAGAATAEKDAAGAANATLEDDAAGASTAAPSATGATAAPSATTSATANAVPQAPPLSDEALDKLPARIRGALEERKVLVLGVLNTAAKPWAPMADDDRRVRDALKGVNRYRGGVVVRTAPFAKLASYDGVLSALQVRQSPTVVVVDRNRQATALTGYVDRVSINQAIVDARRASTQTLIKDPYLRKVNTLCGRFDLRLTRTSMPSGLRGVSPALRRLTSVARRYRRAFASVPAPARWRGLKGDTVRYIDDSVAAVSALERGNAAGYRRTGAALTRRSAALDRRFEAAGLTACSSSRTQ